MKRQPLPDDVYCPNPDCALFGQVEARQLERHAYCGPQRTVHYLCRTCGKTFSETKGTFFYRLRTEREKILNALAIVAEQGGIRATARVTGVDKDTIQRWVVSSSIQIRAVSGHLLSRTHGQNGRLFRECTSFLRAPCEGLVSGPLGEFSRAGRCWAAGLAGRFFRGSPG